MSQSQWFDFEPEPQTTGDGSGDPDKQILTIATDDGEELAVIVHRTCHGGFPIDGPTANHKRALAEHIVTTLNTYNQPLPQYANFLQEADPA